MITREQVQTVIQRVRPYLQADGGDVELLEVCENQARVRFIGNCSGCASAHVTLHLGIEAAIKEEYPDFEGLVVV